MRRNKGSEYILKLPEGSTLTIKEYLGKSVNPDRCLVQARYRTSLMLLSEDKSWNQRVVCQDICFEEGDYLLFLLHFRSIGVFYSLTTEGHIEVINYYLLFKKEANF